MYCNLCSPSDLVEEDEGDSESDEELEGQKDRPGHARQRHGKEDGRVSVMGEVGKMSHKYVWLSSKLW